MKKGRPWLALTVLGVICLGCLTCELFIPKDPAYLDLYHANEAPSRDFWFGTDTLGRDVLSMIWYGGRISLAIGLGATALTTLLAILVGTACGLGPKWLDDGLMRATELVLSVPSLMLTVLLQGILGQANVASIALVIGLTGWPAMAKVVRAEVRQLRSCEYVTASRAMGGRFWWVLGKHLLPNFFPGIVFMVVMNVRSAVVAESTLSFLGIGLPLEIISWGSMLSLADQAILSGAWWLVLIPGAFLVVTILAITDLGNALQTGAADRPRYL